MRRLGTIFIAVALVATLMAVPLGAAASVSDHGEQNETETIAPGEQLAGVVGVQSAAVDGDLSDRTYEVKVANAQTNESKADVVGERLTELEQRLADHEAKLTELAAEREAGNISEGAYRAKVATVSAEKANTERAAEQVGETAGQLPETVLTERGINVTAIEELQTNARELGGPETAEIARSIGGDKASTPLAGNRTETADREALGGNATTAGNQASDTNRNTGADTTNRQTGDTDQSPTDDKPTSNNEDSNDKQSNDRQSDDKQSSDRQG